MRPKAGGGRAAGWSRARRTVLAFFYSPVEVCGGMGGKIMAFGAQTGSAAVTDHDLDAPAVCRV
eukprot:1361497-Pleurochrysis_carterae.AAC.2